MQNTAPVELIGRLTGLYVAQSQGAANGLGGMRVSIVEDGRCGQARLSGWALTWGAS